MTFQHQPRFPGFTGLCFQILKFHDFAGFPGTDAYIMDSHEYIDNI